jgi:hypothetical protein
VRRFFKALEFFREGVDRPGGLSYMLRAKM